MCAHVWVYATANREALTLTQFACVRERERA